MKLKTSSALLPTLVLLLAVSTRLTSAHDSFDDDEEEASVHHGEDESIVSVETLRAEDDVVYITPDTHPDVFFAEHFDEEEAYEKKWIKSQV